MTETNQHKTEEQYPEPPADVLQEIEEIDQKLDELEQRRHDLLDRRNELIQPYLGWQETSI